MPTFSRSLTVPHPVSVLFGWHERPGAFGRLNPPWQPVEVVSQTGGIRDGARVKIRVPLGPIGIPWSLTHHSYRENEQFCDRQRWGPFLSWDHRHLFSSNGPAQSTLRDEITFRTPLPVLGDAFVARDLERLFTYRHTVTANDLASHARFSSPRPLRIGVTGSSGLVGSQLVPFLLGAGHTVVLFKRSGSEGVVWNPEKGIESPEKLPELDAVIHLAGAGIADKRWSAERKAELVTSRVQGTASLVASLAKAPVPPKLFISASAVGIYGDTGDHLVTEDSPGSDTFLGSLAAQWEEEARKATQFATRIVHLRLGVVLDPRGGALQKMLPSFLCGVGGRVGSGLQWMSWIALDDVLSIIERSLVDESISGPINVIAPEPVTNRMFTETLGRVLCRPTIFPAPAFALRAAFGEMADAALLSSCRASPKRLLAAGHPYLFPYLEGALRFMLGRP